MAKFHQNLTKICTLLVHLNRGNSRKNKPHILGLQRNSQFWHTSFKRMSMRICRQPMKDNIELPCRVPWERKRLLQFAGKVISRPHRKNEWVKWSPKIHKEKQFLVRLYCFIKISCIRFLWLGPSVRFASTWHLLLTVSWRTLVFSVLGNVTNSLFLCGAMRDVNEICKSRFTTLFIFIRFTA